MKKLLLGSAALAILSIAITIFQISCQKTVNAQSGTSYILPAATTSSLGGIIVGSGLNITSGGVLSSTTSGPSQINVLLFSKRKGSGPFIYELWTSNYDGTNQNKININLGAGLSIVEEGSSPKLSPDGRLVFFHVSEGNYNNIYSCNIDGSNVRKIISGSAAYDRYIMGGAY